MVTTPTTTSEQLDMAQIRALYEEYHSRVFRFFRLHTGTKEWAEELLSATFERAIANRRRFNASKGTLEVWLFTIARNLLRDYFRKAGKHRHDALDAASHIISAEKAPDEQAMLQEEHRQLAEALRLLPDRDRTAILLKHIAGLRTAEIAKVLQVTEKNASVILARGMKKLRAIMNEEVPK